MDTYEADLRGNIRKLYWLAMTNGGAFFSLPIFVVFYQASASPRRGRYSKRENGNAGFV